MKQPTKTICDYCQDTIFGNKMVVKVKGYSGLAITVDFGCYLLLMKKRLIKQLCKGSFEKV